MIAFHVSIDGEERLLARLGRMEQNIGDLNAAGAWQEVSEVLSRDFETLFQREGAMNGPEWSRLAPRTIASRVRRRLTPIRVGWARGRMAQSLIEPTAVGAIEIRTPTEFVRGTGVNENGVSYPALFDRGRKGQPARPILARLFTGKSETITKIVDAMRKAIMR